MNNSRSIPVSPSNGESGKHLCLKANTQEIYFKWVGKISIADGIGIDSRSIGCDIRIRLLDKRGVRSAGENRLQNHALLGLHMVLDFQHAGDFAQILHARKLLDLDLDLHRGFGFDLFPLSVQDGNVQGGNVEALQVDPLALFLFVCQNRPASVVILAAVLGKLTHTKRRVRRDLGTGIVIHDYTVGGTVRGQEIRGQLFQKDVDGKAVGREAEIVLVSFGALHDLCRTGVVNMNHGGILRRADDGTAHGHLDGDLGLDLFFPMVEGDIHGAGLAHVVACHRGGRGSQDALILHQLQLHAGIGRESALRGLHRHGHIAHGVFKVLRGEEDDRFAVGIGIDRQQAVAHHAGLGISQREGLHKISPVAFDGHQGVILQIGRRHNAHVVGDIVIVKVVEYQIAGFGIIVLRRGVHAQLRQLIDPMAAVAVHRHVLLRDTRPADAEGGEHGAPVTIGDAVPGAVAGVALDAAGAADGVVGRALTVAQLRARHCQQVFAPVAAELQVEEHVVPVVPGLYTGVRITGGHPGIGLVVDVVLLLFVQSRNLFRCHVDPLEALLAVDVGFQLHLAADQIARRVVAALIVDVNALKAADGLFDLVPAALVVGVGAGALLQTADQLVGQRMAGVTVGMGLHFGKTADQLTPDRAVAAVVVSMAGAFRLAADQLTPDRTVAVLVVGVLLAFLQTADQLRGPAVAVVTVPVLGVLYLAAGEIGVPGVAVVAVRMAFRLGKAADELLAPGVAVLGVHVARALLQTADGLFHGLPTGVRVVVRRDLRQRAQQLSLGVVAVVVMHMGHIARIPLACRRCEAAVQHLLFVSERLALLGQRRHRSKAHKHGKTKEQRKIALIVPLGLDNLFDLLIQEFCHSAHSLSFGFEMLCCLSCCFLFFTG